MSFLELSTAINTKTAGLPKELADVTLNCRYVYRAPFELPDPVRKYGNLTLTYAAQVHIAVIEIDPLTHNICVLDYAVVEIAAGLSITPSLRDKLSGRQRTDLAQLCWKT